uniref:Uncharacterized protein n=1 Tax=Anopheles maculatus TaxID=74869 RepID=A0A182SMV8_9DIPT
MPAVPSRKRCVAELDNCWAIASEISLHPLLWKRCMQSKFPTRWKKSATGVCRIFNRGMECVRQYLKECVNARQRKIIENEVYGAKKLYEFLCYDQAFQQEFLRHKSCFQLVHPEWDLCSNQFLGVLKDEMARTTKQSINVQYIHFCCARYAYENCVYSSARFICKPDSAMFLRRIAKLLSTDKHFLNCDKIENELCSGAVRQLASVSPGCFTFLGSLAVLTMGRRFAVR